jgi:anthranilate/para-aminobenzoate synthase component I
MSRGEQSLLADPKENAEHVMLVDLARNDLGRVARPVPCTSIPTARSNATAT